MHHPEVSILDLGETLGGPHRRVAAVIDFVRAERHGAVYAVLVVGLATGDPLLHQPDRHQTPRSMQNGRSGHLYTTVLPR